MFKFTKQIFISTMMLFKSLLISMKNRECKVRPEVANINSNDPICYPFSIKVNKCSGNCIEIDVVKIKNENKHKK